MLDPGAVPSVDSEETLARYVLFSRYIKSSDNSIRADAFIPHPYADLSVTRHREATELELWNEGRRIADSCERTLHGRADVSASVFIAAGLFVVPEPDLPKNPNHANVINWPTDKPAQKLKAIQIANEAVYLAAP